MTSSLRSDATGLLGALQINGTDAVTFTPTGIDKGLEHPLKSIVGSVVANALNVGLAATTLEFRSTSLSNGSTTRLATSSLTMTVPASATLGTTNAVASTIVLLAINNAGTIELAVVNLAGGLNLDETTLISTTALTSASNSATVIYSMTARTNVPFRVLGYIESTQATAGTWATAPSKVQGAGNRSASGSGSFGIGQTWVNVTASRAINTNYVNSTGKPIQVAVTFSGTNAGIRFYVDGIEVARQSTGVSSGTVWQSVQVVVPPGATYNATQTFGTLYNWAELS